MSVIKKNAIRKAIDRKTNETVDFSRTLAGFIIHAPAGDKEVSISTFKRWYKVIGEEAQAEEVAALEQLAPLSEELEIVEAPVAEAQADSEEAEGEEAPANDSPQEMDVIIEPEAPKAPKAAKAAVVVPPCPVEVEFVSSTETTSERSRKTRTYLVLVKVDGDMFEMTDSENAEHGRGTVACKVTRAGELVYNSKKFSAQDCLNHLAEAKGWDAEAVKRINVEIRSARKANIVRVPFVALPVLTPVVAETLAEASPSGEGGAEAAQA